MPATEQLLHSDDFGTDDQRWRAVRNRDRFADGRFVYAVKTTGVYCRPACPSRLPLCENVLFLSSPAEARRAGYRPCKRCFPNQTTEDRKANSIVGQACRKIEQQCDIPQLATIASDLAISPSRLQRLFKKQTGLTFKAYADALRTSRLRHQLDAGDSVTQAIVRAGYRSLGRFYTQSKEILGMSPSQFQNGGNGTKIRFGIGQTSLGAILVAMTEKGICSILLGDDPARLLQDLQDRFSQAELSGGDADFEQHLATVIGFVEDPYLGLDLPLDVRGTAFQQRVWQALRKIPPGRTATYTDIARRIGSPQSVRAVASACAANPIGIAIPCHRVVRLDGSLSGYRWGIDRKSELLRRERFLKSEQEK